jgi:hypothetical protein
MSSITQYFQPPLYWQQFEDLTAGVFSAVYRDPKPTKFGRPGQAQNGVDIYGYENGNGRLIAIQCKRMDELDEHNLPRPGGAISQKLLDREINEMRKGFRPLPDTWILATTAKRDAAIQRYAAKLDRKSRDSGSFGIQLWFWDDFITDLNRYHELQHWYYASVIQVRSSDDQDKIILELIGEAFSRAAFRMPLYQETPSEFIQALKDTQHAINTGELKDRETRRVIRKAIGGRRAVESKPINDQLRNADEKLQKLREQFQHSIDQAIIRQSGTTLLIPPGLQSDLSRLRDDAVAAVNDGLRQAGLQPV